MSDKSESNNQQNFAKISLAVVVLLLLFLLFEEDANKSVSETLPRQPSGVPARPYSIDRVNDHILLTQDSIEIQAAKTKEELRRTVETPAKPQAKKHSSETLLNFDYDRSHEAVAQDLGRAKEPGAAPSTPHELIQAQIYNKELQAQRMDEYYERKRNLIIENARAKGYQVEVDYKGEKILKWKKIKRSSASERMTNGTGSAAK
ncbi:MAG: hypothetical protein ACLGGX_00100 [Bdellovibrionia bacterium]